MAWAVAILLVLFALNYFDFYDAGSAGVCEALRDRLGIAPPWDKHAEESASS